MNHLLRGHAPLTDSNWKLLDEEAAGQADLKKAAELDSAYAVKAKGKG